MLKQIRNTIQKSTHYNQENYNAVVAFQEATGSKSLSEAVNILLERAFENLNNTNHMFEQFESQIKDLRREIKDSKNETINQSNRLVSIYNTGFRLQARTYGIVRMAEESRTTFHDSNWNNVEPKIKELRRNSSIVCDAFEQKFIKQEFENLKKVEDNKGL